LSEYLAFPAVREARGAVRVPASKSATNRALLLAALAGFEIEIVRPLESEDTDAIRACLAAMGASISPSEEGVRVRGPLGLAAGERAVLDARDSGTAARLLAAVASAVAGRFVVTGSERLRERPVGDLVDALRAAGARIRYAHTDGLLPLEIEGATLRPGASVRVDASRSGQFLSALLIAGAALQGEGGLEASAAGPVASEPYVRLTAAMLREFGHSVEDSGGGVRVRPGSTRISRYEPRGDWSSAVPLLAAAAVAGGRVEARGVAWPPDGTEADAAAAEVFERMGAAVEGSAGGVSVSASQGALRPVAVAATGFPDAVPALAACAAFAEGESRFTGIGHMRWKESDRIDALADLLQAAGVEAAAEPGALVVRGQSWRGARPWAARLPTRNDHRIAMAGGLLALRLPGMLVESPRSVAKSYPGFWRDLESLAVRSSETPH
jgi:3-phosphoshikimate 1-carboxyvinyltransferase